jgi:hypothetical protein
VVLTFLAQKQEKWFVFTSEAGQKAILEKNNNKGKGK